MPLVFITGISGVGKSTVMNELIHQGYEAYDTDHNGLSVWRDKLTGGAVGDKKFKYGTKEWFDKFLWTLLPEKVEQIKKSAKNKVVFLCGCPGNSLEIIKFFDKTICLNVDDETLKQRVESRKNRYPNEADDILEWNKDFTTRMAKSGATVIDASGTVKEITQKIKELILK